MLKGNGRLNVIDVNGSLHLSTQQKWTLSGTEHDLFVLRIQGNLAFEQTGSLLLDGVLARNVILYLPSANANATLSNLTEASGTFLIPNGTASIHNNSKVKGAIFARHFITLDNNVGSFDPAPFCPLAWEGYTNPAPTPAPTVAPTCTPVPSATPVPSDSPNPYGP